MVKGICRPVLIGGLLAPDVTKAWAADASGTAPGADASHLKPGAGDTDRGVRMKGRVNLNGSDHPQVDKE